ncbi:hypothetical protein NHX12_022424, partial [Muraenolepis orangiensis]
MASVRVAVRVRPLNKREHKLSSKVIIRVKDNTTSLLDTKAKVFQDLGLDVLHSAFQGFNACVFAYGQTGSGKSYTMMGDAGDKGLIPRICEGLFCEISLRSERDAVSFRTEVSYLEIYNERVLDLLHKRPSSAPKGGLRVREHPMDGPYVENLSRHVVHGYDDVKELMDTGNANRTTASTGMNDASSRSHAIFTVSFTQARFDSLPCETLSKLHLVDLAGSERADATQATGTRLKEGANINKSLVTLGSVISALADMGDKRGTKKLTFVPYRDSVLTWLLKDSLGGNSKTIMIATVSPADVNYGETLSTLRYASRAKNIVNTPTVNEDVSVKVIRELQAEITRLRGLLDNVTLEVPLLNSSASVVLELTMEWTNKWWETDTILKLHDCVIMATGLLEEILALRKEGSGVEGRTLVGSDETSSGLQDTGVLGPGWWSEHCVFENRGGTVSILPGGAGEAPCLVNGVEVTEPCQLNQGAIVQLGQATIFRFNHPTEAAQLRRERQNGQLSSMSLSMTDLSKASENLAKFLLLQPSVMGPSNAPAYVPFRDPRRSWPRPLQRALRKPQFAQAGWIGCSECRLYTSESSGAQPFCRGVAGAAALGRVSAWDVHEQVGDRAHKSGPRTVPPPPRPGGERETGSGVRSCEGGEPRSGGFVLRQTGVPGPGDGYAAAPEGDANESQGVAADFCQGRPGSGGSSLEGAAPRRRSAGGTSCGLVPPQTAENTHNSPVPRPPAPEARLGGGEIDDERGDAEGWIPGEASELRAAAGSDRLSGLGSLVSRVSWMLPDASRILGRLPGVPGFPGVTETCLSGQVVSLIRRRQVLNAVRTSQVFSLISESYAFSLVKDSHVFSVVRDFPLIRRLQVELSQPMQSCGVELPRHSSPVEDESGLCSMQEFGFERLDIQSEEERLGVATALALPAPLSCKSQAAVIVTKEAESPTAAAQGSILTPEDVATVWGTEGVQIIRQNLLQFPDIFIELQSMPPPQLVASLRSLVPGAEFPSSQKAVALYWLEAATRSSPRPRPALVLLLEAGLYTLTSDGGGTIALLHHFPLRHLREVHVGLAGQSLRLMGGGPAEETALGLHTRSWRLTQEVCRTLLGALCPGDDRVSMHPLLRGDLAAVSLDWHARVPDLLLDAGLKVTCWFQKALADLVYFLHSNMPPGKPSSVAEVRVLLYASARVCVSPGGRTEPLAYFFLTETHLGLVQEDAVFRPAAPHRSQFLNLALRSRADVRCLLLHHADGRASASVD